MQEHIELITNIQQTSLLIIFSLAMGLFIEYVKDNFIAIWWYFLSALSGVFITTSIFLIWV